jgi:hypothetical protein
VELIDSSAWIESLCRTGSRANVEVREMWQERPGDVAITEPVVMETPRRRKRTSRCSGNWRSSWAGFACSPSTRHSTIATRPPGGVESRTYVIGSLCGAGNIG